MADERYTTITQFYADIELTISNSLLFNRANPDFCKLTNDFKKCFEKLKAEPIVVSRFANKPIERKSSQASERVPQNIQKSKSECKNFLTISEKRELAAKIKSLPKANIIEIA